MSYSECLNAEVLWQKAIREVTTNVVVDESDIKYALSQYDINQNAGTGSVKPNLVNKRDWLAAGNINDKSFLSKFDTELNWYQYDASINQHMFSSWKAYNMILAELGFITEMTN